jgi:hypothetical protein
MNLQSKYNPKLPFKTHCNSMESIRDLVKYQLEGTLIIDYDVFLPTMGKNLQRPFCWSLEQKQELIRSIFKEMKLPLISLIEYKRYDDRELRKYQIIDGKQRLSTVIAFVNNEFSVDDLYFKDLDESDSKFILRYSFDREVTYEWGGTLSSTLKQSDIILLSDQSKIEWFKRINFAGVQQEQAHIDSLIKQ